MLEFHIHMGTGQSARLIVTVDPVDLPEYRLMTVEDTPCMPENHGERTARAGAFDLSSEALYRTLFEQAKDAILLEDENEWIVDANPQASALTGYSRDELRSMRTADLQPQELHNNPIATDERFETKVLRKDGVLIPVDITLTRLHGQGEKRFLSIVRDIAPRVEAENRLRESERTLATLMSNLPGMAYRCRNNTDWTMEFVSEGCKRLTGYESKDLEQDRIISYTKLIHPDDREMVWDTVQHGVRRQAPFTITYRITTADGKLKWVWEQGRAIYDNGNEVTSLEGFITDITESRQATESLRASEQRFRALFEDSPIALHEQDFSDVKRHLDALRSRGVSNLQAHFEQNPQEVQRCASLIRTHDINRASVDMYAARNKQEVIDNLDRILTAEAYPAFQQQLIDIAGGSTQFSAESVNHTLAGDRISISLRWAIAPGYEDTWERVFVSIIDLTERVKTEQALKESQQLLQRTLASLRDAVFILNENVEVIECNPAASEIFGYARHEMLGHIGGLLHVSKESHEQFTSRIHHATNEGRVLENVEFPMKRKDGSTFPAERSLIPLEDETGHTIGWVAVARDLTERKRLEKELVKIEKLESVGVLAGGIAHDFNNLLTGILGNIALAKMHQLPASETYAILQEAEAASLRARDLTHQLLTFSKGGAPIKKTAAIADLLRDTTAFALRGSNVRCQFAIAGDLWHVDVDENQFSQVMHNLALNADQAMPDGGRLEVRAENTIIESHTTLPLPSGRYVKVTVRDSGVGIPPDILSRVFDPYFTTKQKGSGLGLATAFSIVQAHGGHITVESQIGVGSTFRAYLPASASAKQEETLPESESHPLPHARILVMDDEAFVRDVARQMLRHFGYDVELAADGEEAIQMYQDAQQAGQAFGIVIMDLTIPGGMGGKDAIDKLRAIDPDVRAIVSSGYANDPIMSDYQKYGFRGVVAKPYDIEDLKNAIQEALASPG